MLLNLMFVLLGLVLLPAGAEGLVRGSWNLALRLGVTALAAGLTIVAFGTSSPELVLSIHAAMAGNSGIALGNVVGSNISNIALVLGLAAVVRPIKVRSDLVRRELPLMIGVTLLLLALLVDGGVSHADGLLLVIGAISYAVFSYLVAKHSAESRADGEGGGVARHPSVPIDIALIVLGLASLTLGAQLLLRGAVFIAGALGVSEVVIGLTVVALGTSLPELATSITSALRDRADVAFGNVIGSNVLNILAVLGVAAVVKPFAVEGLRPADVLMLLATAIILLPLLRRGWVLSRWEGALLVAGYIAYLLSLAS